MNPSEPRRLSEALDELLRIMQPRKKGPAPTTKMLSGVFGRWEDAVGPQVAAHARPVRLSEGALLVEVDEPAWATQLRLLEANLLERITAVAGPGVERIEVRVRRR